MSFIINPFLVAPSGPTSPDQLAGLIRWYKADSYSLADGTQIGNPGLEWLDNSPTGDDAYVEVPYYATFRTNVFGSMPAIQFLSPNFDFLRVTQFTLTLDLTIIFIANVIGSSLIHAIGNSPSGASARIRTASFDRMQFYDGGSGGQDSTNFATSANNVKMASMRRTSDGVIHFRDGNVSRGDVGSSPVPMILRLLGDGGTASNGNLGELCVYNQAHSDSDIDSLYANYFKIRYPTLA